MLVMMMSLVSFFFFKVLPIQVKTKKLIKWFGRRQHLNVAFLLRRRLCVFDGDTIGDRKV